MLFPISRDPQKLETRKEFYNIIDSLHTSSPFGGIPRNWKLSSHKHLQLAGNVPPSGGSLEIGNKFTGNRTHRVLVVFPLRGDP